MKVLLLDTNLNMIWIDNLKEQNRNKNFLQLKKIKLYEIK